MMTEDESDRYGPPSFVLRPPSRIMCGIRFEGRPASVLPPKSESVSVVYRREGDKFRQIGVGQFKGGQWTNRKGDPLDGDIYWLAMVDER